MYCSDLVNDKWAKPGATRVNERDIGSPQLVSWDLWIRSEISHLISFFFLFVSFFFCSLSRNETEKISISNICTGVFHGYRLTLDASAIVWFSGCCTQCLPTSIFFFGVMTSRCLATGLLPLSPSSYPVLNCGFRLCMSWKEHIRQSGGLEQSSFCVLRQRALSFVMQILAHARGESPLLISHRINSQFPLVTFNVQRYPIAISIPNSNSCTLRLLAQIESALKIDAEKGLQCHLPYSVVEIVKQISGPNTLVPANWTIIQKQIINGPIRWMHPNIFQIGRHRVLWLFTRHR